MPKTRSSRSPVVAPVPEPTPTRIRRSRKDFEQATFQPTLRRSSRSKTPQKHNYLEIATGRYQYIADLDFEEDDRVFKSKRKKRRSDSDEFTGVRASRKKQSVYTYQQFVLFRDVQGNRIACLLGWKNANPLPEPPAAKFYKSIKVKSLLDADLSKFGTNVEALFINIRWKSPEQPNGYTIKDLQRLQIDNSKLMSRGIVFLWAQKTLLGEIMDVMEAKGLVYVENLQIVYLSLQKGEQELSRFYTKTAPNSATTISKDSPALETRRGKRSKGEITESTDSIVEAGEMQRKEDFLENLDKFSCGIEGSKLILQKPDRVFNKSKKILLMFRKHDNKKENLELRHQRTCDVVFDLVVDGNTQPDPTTKNYVYKMIETLLPRSVQLDQQNPRLTMMEISGERQTPRRGWINIHDK